MKYENPVIRGFYPDPSICRRGNEYFLVNSTFEYFPGVPVFKSTDLVNWQQVGNCLTRKSQLDIEEADCSCGIFAPTIRYHESKFYMITTCLDSRGPRNFYVCTDDIEGEWSDPVFIPVMGIDPSFFFEDGRTYVQFTDFGIIKQAEIDLETGKVIDGPRILTSGCGGRNAEGPHMFKRNGYYYLMLAEGGTESGHMVTMMRSENVWGPFEASEHNPVISNRDHADEPLQCIEHADLTFDDEGKVYLVTLGTRPSNRWSVLGRETMLTPAYFDEEGWLSVENSMMKLENEISLGNVQHKNKEFKLDIKTGKLPDNIISPRFRHDEYVEYTDDEIIIRGNEYRVDEKRDCALFGIRQSEYDFTMKAELNFVSERQSDEGGLALMMDNEHNMSFVISKRDEKRVLVLRKKVSDIESETIYPLENQDSYVTLIISGDKDKYYFDIEQNEQAINIGSTFNKNLSSESAFSPFTGVVGGLYVTGNSKLHVKEFTYKTK